MRLSLPLGRFWDIDVRVHWSFLLVLPLFLSKGAVGMLLTLALFASVLIHEFGHCFAARSVGGEARQIILWPLGGLAMIHADKGNSWHAIWVSLAGPLTHVPLAGLCAAILAGVGHAPEWTVLNPLAEWDPPGSALWHNLVYIVLKLQVLLFCFNVFTPAFPMDGGQVLAALLSTVMPMGMAAFILAGLNFGVVAIMFQHEQYFLALFLVQYGFFLLTPASDFHVLAPFYKRAGSAVAKPATYVAEGLELKPCPHCGQKLHPAAERCAYCDATYPFRGE